MDDASPYDALLAKHLTSVPSARLFVGDDLAQVNWAGVEMAFGLPLNDLPSASLLAFYDDSAFGRGRRGFLVADDAVVYVQRDRVGRFALAEVQGVLAVPDALTLQLRDAHGHDTFVTLRLADFYARSSVERWLRAVASFNRGASERPGRVTAVQALERLETMAAARQLTTAHRERLRALVERLNRQDDRR